MQFQVKQVKNPVYNIIGDGGMSLPGLGEGRFIPCLIIDANNTSEISDLIKHHQNTDAGDAVQQWGRPLSLLPSKHLILQVKFTQPMEVSIGISFELKTQYSLIDGIIQSRAFFFL